MLVMKNTFTPIREMVLSIHWPAGRR